MSGPVCRFCSHRNPEGSSFCNACGSPLHLAPCAQCEAINNATDERCASCGAALPAAAAGPVEHEPALETAQAAAGSVPIALADRLEEAPLEQAAWSVDEPFASVESATAVDDDAAALAARPHGSDWKPDRLRGILLGVAFVVIAGGVAWTVLNAPQAIDTTTQGSTPTAAPAPARAPVEATQPAATPAETAQPIVAAPAEPPAPQTPATDQDAPLEAGTPSPPDSSSASLEAPKPPAPVKARKAAKTEAPAPGETRHANTADGRSREQAERDAIATQRIIARELANTPGAGPGAQPSPTR